MTGSQGGFGVLVLNALCFIKNDAIPKAVFSKENKLVLRNGSVKVRILITFPSPLLLSFIFCTQCSIRRKNYVETPERFP